MWLHGIRDSYLPFRICKGLVLGPLWTPESQDAPAPDVKWGVACSGLSASTIPSIPNRRWKILCPILSWLNPQM